jgi:hypothetical protein
LAGLNAGETGPGAIALLIQSSKPFAMQCSPEQIRQRVTPHDKTVTFEWHTFLPNSEGEKIYSLKQKGDVTL